MIQLRISIRRPRTGAFARRVRRRAATPFVTASRTHFSTCPAESSQPAPPDAIVSHLPSSSPALPAHQRSCRYAGYLLELGASRARRPPTPRRPDPRRGTAVRKRAVLRDSRSRRGRSPSQHQYRSSRTSAAPSLVHGPTPVFRTKLLAAPRRPLRRDSSTPRHGAAYTQRASTCSPAPAA